MITVEELVAAGFQEFNDSLSRANRFFQKRIRSEFNEETRYFINVYHYIFSEQDTWELNMSFDRDDEKFPYCWWKMHIDETATVDDIMAVAADTFEKNRGVAYGD